MYEPPQEITRGYACCIPGGLQQVLTAPGPIWRPPVSWGANTPASECMYAMPSGVVVVLDPVYVREKDPVGKTKKRSALTRCKIHLMDLLRSHINRI